MHIKPVVTLVVLMMVCSVQSEIVQDVSTNGFDSTVAGWLTVSSPAGASDITLDITHDPSRVYTGTGALELSYTRTSSHASGMYGLERMTGLSLLEFSVRSQYDGFAGIFLTDRDGAVFQHVFALSTETWTHLSVEPDDFILATSSPVWKAALEPDRLHFGLSLFDVSGSLGRTETNALWVDALRIDRGLIDHRSGDWIIDGTHEQITSNTWVDGDISIINHGSLNVDTPAFVLNGSVSVESGGCIITNATMDVKQAHRVEHRLSAGGGNLVLSDVSIFSVYPIMNLASSGGIYLLDTMQSMGAALHIDVLPSGNLVITNSGPIGEIVLSPGSYTSISDSEFVLSWLSIGSSVTSSLALPPGEYVGNYQLDPGIGMTLNVQNSSNMQWGLLTLPASDLSISGTTFRAVGMLFTESSPAVEVTGFTNGQSYATLEGMVSDRQMTLTNSHVEAWNMYGVFMAEVAITDCLFGEVLALGNSTVTVSRSHCDGLGGYLGTEQNARLILIDTVADCDLAATENSSIELQRCTILNDISAAGTSTAILWNCEFTGQAHTFDDAVIELINVSTDGDWLPDAWEIAMLGSLDFGATNDPDEDKVTNLDEYIAGTHPTNSASLFEFGVHSSNGQAVVSFNTVMPGGAGYDRLERYYCLESSANLTNGAWQPVPGYSNIVSTGLPVNYTNTTETTPLFFQGNAQLVVP